jgi:hypothetical protein
MMKIIYAILEDDDQPTTCPLCGARTDFTELENGQQEHTCLSPQCGYSFLVEFDEE